MTKNNWGKTTKCIGEYSLTNECAGIILEPSNSENKEEALICLDKIISIAKPELIKRQEATALSKTNESTY